MAAYAALSDLPFAHTLPRNAALAPGGGLAVAGCDLRELAEEFGTPLYVFDEDHFRGVARDYREAFAAHWDEEVVVAYAAKAFLCKAVAAIAAEERLGMDVVSGGELAVARDGGFPPERMYFHGNNKSRAELEQAVAAGIGHIVVDSFHELALLEEVAGEAGRPQHVLLRISPNVDAHTHAKTTTGILDTKFGFAIATGDAERAVVEAIGATYIDLQGLHVHLGSPIFDLAPYAEGCRVMAEFAAAMRDRHGMAMPAFSPGGGFALAYTREHHPPAIASYAETICGALGEHLGARDLPRPSLHLEPGRSVVGGAMIAVYEVGARKVIPGVRTYVSLDGGMADNIRPAMYGAVYEALSVDRPLSRPEETVTLAGKYCESGDILVRDAEVPRLDPGELVGVPASGGYNLAMASNYNMAFRPPVVAVRDREARVIVRRETVDDLVARDA